MAMQFATFNLRRGTASQWTLSNPILGPGEPGFELDTNKVKIGNGTSRWTELKYFLNQDALTTLFGGAYAVKSVEDLVTIGRLSEVTLAAQISQQIRSEAVTTPVVYGSIAGTSVQGNDSRLAKDTLNASIILETAIGVWTDDPPARTGGKQKIIYVSVSDPADPVNGVKTPANIAPTDVWFRRV